MCSFFFSLPHCKNLLIQFLRLRTTPCVMKVSILVLGFTLHITAICRLLQSCCSLDPFHLCSSILWHHYGHKVSQENNSHYRRGRYPFTLREWLAFFLDEDLEKLLLSRGKGKLSLFTCNLPKWPRQGVLLWSLGHSSHTIRDYERSQIDVTEPEQIKTQPLNFFFY